MEMTAQEVWTNPAALRTAWTALRAKGMAGVPFFRALLLRSREAGAWS